MALVRKARSVCCVCQGGAARDHFSRALKPTLDKIGMWREARSFREATQKLELADAADCGQFIKRQRGRGIIIDALACLLYGLGRSGPSLLIAMFNERGEKQEQIFSTFDLAASAMRISHRAKEGQETPGRRRVTHYGARKLG